MSFARPGRQSDCRRADRADWAAFTAWAAAHGQRPCPANPHTRFIDPGSPWQNPYLESFNSRARDELFAREIFDSILEAKVLYADWCHAYNVHRPHSALSYQSPAVFAKAHRQS